MFRRKKDHCDGTEVGGEAASAGDAADILHVRKWKAAREDKGGGRRSGRPRPWKWAQALLDQEKDEEEVKKTASEMQNENVYYLL